MENIIYARGRVLSTASKGFFYSVVPSGIAYLDCHLHNVIYLINCSKCSIEYLEKTWLKVNERFNWNST